MFRRYARTVVLDADMAIQAGGKVVAARVFFLGAAVGCLKVIDLDVNPPQSVHGVRCIDQQVDQDLLQLCRVRMHGIVLQVGIPSQLCAAHET